MSKTIAIGADVGGSHVCCEAVDLSRRAFVAGSHSESKLDNQWPADDILKVWSATLKQTLDLIEDGQRAGIGFAMPGPFDYVNGVPLFKGNNKKYESIYGLDIPALLRKALGVPDGFPIRFINDATAFALGEDFLGAAQGKNRSLSITLGTGFGSAFLEGHLPVVSGDKVPETGAVWHLPFKNGNADDYFSTRGLLNRFADKTGQQLAGVKDLAELAPTNATANDLFVDFGTELGNFLAPWMGRFGAEVLVIGGNISRALPLFGASLQNSLARHGVQAPVALSTLHESAALIGSALLADNEYYNKLLPILAHM